MNEWIEDKLRVWDRNGTKNGIRISVWGWLGESEVYLNMDEVKCLIDMLQKKLDDAAPTTTVHRHWINGEWRTYRARK